MANHIKAKCSWARHTNLDSMKEYVNKVHHFYSTAPSQLLEIVSDKQKADTYSDRHIMLIRMVPQ